MLLLYYIVLCCTVNFLHTALSHIAMDFAWTCFDIMNYISVLYCSVKSMKNCYRAVMYCTATGMLLDTFLDTLRAISWTMPRRCTTSSSWPDVAAESFPLSELIDGGASINQSSAFNELFQLLLSTMHDRDPTSLDWVSTRYGFARVFYSEIDSIHALRAISPLSEHAKRFTR